MWCWVVRACSAHKTIRNALLAVKQGFTCLKFKVGGAPPASDVERIAAVRAAVGDTVLIRLDANGAWDAATARSTLRRLAASDIEYIEQPVASIEELAELRREGILPIAADENEQHPSGAERVIELRAADLLVIKPMAAGGLIEARRIAEKASNAGMDVVFTSFIDSAVGRHAVAQLCAAMPQLARHHGLATGALFLDDVGSDNIVEGRYHLSDAAGIGFVPSLEHGHASA